MASEESVGIRAYITNQKGFVGILRHKYSDFKVHEVDLSGQVARLTSFDIPKPQNQNQSNPSNDKDTPESTIDSIVSQYNSIIGSDVTKTEQLTIFLQQAQTFHKDASQPRPDPVELDPAPEKDQRRALHSIFKDISWLPPLQTITAGSGEDSLITLSLRGTSGGRNDRRNNQNNKRKRDADSDWHGGNTRYVRFVLYKENEDTHAAITGMSKFLGIKPRCFSVAGTKDKRAVTVQFATAFKTSPSKLSRINGRMRGVRVGNFEYFDDEVRLGDLQGNKFGIILRGIKVSDDGNDGDATTTNDNNTTDNTTTTAIEQLVSSASSQLKQHGFINYFGLQRFGSGDVPTHSVGASLLKGQWQKTIELLLHPSPTMRPEQLQALQEYAEHKNAAITLPRVPHQFVAGRAVLSILAREDSSNQYVNALTNIPRGLRTMYLHAYQSYLWNEATSERILRYGIDTVVKGDLILPREAMVNARKRKHEQFTNKSSNNNNTNNDANDDINDDDDDDMMMTAVVPHIVTEEEAEKKVFSIEDVVLTLPGSNVIWPENDIKDVYTDTAKKDGISINDVDGESHRVKEFSWKSLAGGYRHIIYRPDDFEYEVVKYDNKDDELTSTDLRDMERKEEKKEESGGGDGRFVALKLSFTLPSSTYATMLIRELTKMNTSLSFIKSVQHPE